MVQILNRKRDMHTVLIVATQSAAAIIFRALRKLGVNINAFGSAFLKAGDPATLNVEAL